MKFSSTVYLVVTTLVLITVTIFATMGFPFSWIFYLTVLGQALLILSVYKVLNDHYTTDKTFEDFYEYYPIGREG